MERRTGFHLKNSLFSDTRLPIAVMAAATVLYALPLFQNVTYWGRPDWDQFTFWNAVPRETLLRYGQIPLWNPFSNGGNVMLAMPHSSFLSPLYLPVLLLGPVVGLKVQWAACVLLGMLGMHALARRFDLAPFSRLLPPFVFMLSSLYSLHLREGHAEWAVMALLPWTFLCWLLSRTDSRHLASTALCLALMIYSGGVYMSAMTAFFLAAHALAGAWEERSAAPPARLAAALALAALLAAAKLVPMRELLRESPRPTIDSGRLEAILLPKLFMLRDQNFLYENRDAVSARVGTNWHREGWHEFGVYTGVLPLLLAFAGLYAHYRRQRVLFWTGLACLWVSMGRTAWFVDLWALLHRLPPYTSLQVPSRFLTCVLLCTALFAGLGLSDWEKSSVKGWRRWVAPGVLLVVLLDLLSVTRPILANAFPIPPLAVSRGLEFVQGGGDFKALLAQGSNSAMYPALLANRGTIASYDIVGVKRGKVLGVADPGYRGEAYLAGSGGTARVVSFSPNRVEIAVEAAREDALVLNQNFSRGWKVRTASGSTPAVPRDGLLSAPVGAGAATVTFVYRPASVLFGLLLSALGLAAAAALWRFPR